jgi:hypothetical protein
LGFRYFLLQQTGPNMVGRVEKDFNLGGVEFVGTLTDFTHA